MLKRNHLSLLLALLALVATATAQEALSLSGPKLAGTTTAGFADFNLLGNPDRKSVV